MIPFIVCPATCELCGDWLPEHQSSCPRNGVHPSQWSLSYLLKEEEEKMLKDITKEQRMLRHIIEEEE